MGRGKRFGRAKFTSLSVLELLQRRKSDRQRAPYIFVCFSAAGRLKRSSEDIYICVCVCMWGRVEEGYGGISIHRAISHSFIQSVS